MDVLHLQGMTTPVMVSGAAVCGGSQDGGGKCGLFCLGSLQNRDTGAQEYSFLGRLVRTFQFQNRKRISS